MNFIDSKKDEDVYMSLWQSLDFTMLPVGRSRLGALDFDVPPMSWPICKLGSYGPLFAHKGFVRDVF